MEQHMREREMLYRSVHGTFKPPQYSSLFPMEAKNGFRMTRPAPLCRVRASHIQNFPLVLEPPQTSISTSKVLRFLVALEAFSLPL